LSVGSVTRAFYIEKPAAGRVIRCISGQAVCLEIEIIWRAADFVFRSTGQEHLDTESCPFG
ncbi:hypothetical protein ACFLYO_08335, partial [Chloroflexota bacterium]